MAAGEALTARLEARVGTRLQNPSVTRPGWVQRGVGRSWRIHARRLFLHGWASRHSTSGRDLFLPESCADLGIARLQRSLLQHSAPHEIQSYINDHVFLAADHFAAAEFDENLARVDAVLG